MSCDVDSSMISLKLLNCTLLISETFLLFRANLPVSLNSGYLDQICKDYALRKSMKKLLINISIKMCSCSKKSFSMLTFDSKYPRLN